MISIIICSVNKIFARQVQENIAATIGVEWEAIVIDNTIVPKSITAVYNEGAAKAKYDILCFAHEDILFKTQDWGKKIAELFDKDKKLGLIGVAGCKYKSQTPSGWFTGMAEADCCNIKHLNRHGITETLYFNPSDNALSQEVKVADGVFLCSTKKVWQQIPFEEKLLNGFHLYDIDFSFRIAQQFTAIVTYEIDILHITKGNHFDKRWLDYTLLWHHKMNSQLPVVSADVSINNKEAEKKIVKTWLVRLKHEKLSLRYKLRWLFAVKIWRYPAAWPNVFLFITKRFFSNNNAPSVGQ
jgi:hypothetical protein